jgi:hypothetical protein
MQGLHAIQCRCGTFFADLQRGGYGGYYTHANVTLSAILSASIYTIKDDMDVLLRLSTNAVNPGQPMHEPLPWPDGGL